MSEPRASYSGDWEENLNENADVDLYNEFSSPRSSLVYLDPEYLDRNYNPIKIKVFCEGPKLKYKVTDRKITGKIRTPINFELCNVCEDYHLIIKLKNIEPSTQDMAVYPCVAHKFNENIPYFPPNEELLIYVNENFKPEFLREGQHPCIKVLLRSDLYEDCKVNVGVMFKCQNYCRKKELKNTKLEQGRRWNLVMAVWKGEEKLHEEQFQVRICADPNRDHDSEDSKKPKGIKRKSEHQIADVQGTDEYPQGRHLMMVEMKTVEDEQLIAQCIKRMNGTVEYLPLPIPEGQ